MAISRNPHIRQVETPDGTTNSIPDSSWVVSQLDSIKNCLANLPQGLACGGGNNLQKNVAGAGSSSSGSGSYDPSATLWAGGKYCITTTVTIEPDPSLTSGKETALGQNTPNPFRYRTQFEYYIGEGGYVELVIHSPDRKLIATLADERQPEGSYTVNWETSDLAPGLYFYTLKEDGVEWVKKAVRVR